MADLEDEGFVEVLSRATHIKNHGPLFEHMDRTYCPPLADPALKRAPRVRTSPYARKVVRRS